MRDYGVIEKTEVSMFGLQTVRYPLMNPQYLTENNLWDGEWLEKLPKTNEQLNLFNGL